MYDLNIQGFGQTFKFYYGDATYKFTTEGCLEDGSDSYDDT